MGCKWSKNSKKNAYSRVAQYQKESFAAEHSLRVHPKSLEWVTPPAGCITSSCLHNLLTDGFYAPFIANPNYLLLIDCRDAKSFFKKTLITSVRLDDLEDDNHQSLMNYSYIVLYDEAPRVSAPSINDTDPLARMFHKLKSKNLDPKIVVGGYTAIEIICEHLLVAGRNQKEESNNNRVVKNSPDYLPWYPTLIVPGFLFLGHSQIASNRNFLKRLRVSHVIALSDIVPARVLPSTNYLIVPLSDDDDDSIVGTDLVSAMPTILAFIEEAQALGGSVLVQCEQGLTKAAIIVMAILMADRRCSLEDAFYFVRGARSSVCPSDNLLQQLMQYEIFLYGAQVSVIEELF